MREEFHLRNGKPKNIKIKRSLVAQWVKDLLLSLQRLGSLLWHGFSPLLGNVNMPFGKAKKKKERKKERKRKIKSK